MNAQPQRNGPSPLLCAVTLGEAVRDEHGRAGVEAYVNALAPLLPRDLTDQLAYRLNVPAPSPPCAVPPPPAAEAAAAGYGKALPNAAAYGTVPSAQHVEQLRKQPSKNGVAVRQAITRNKYYTNPSNAATCAVRLTPFGFRRPEPHRVIGGSRKIPPQRKLLQKRSF